jgi:glycosyltransferase involved in cell wall biosynthesis
MNNITPIRILYIEENRDGTTGGSHACLLDIIRALDKTKVFPLVMFYEENRLLNDFKAETAQVFIYNRPKAIQFRNLPNDFFLIKIPRIFYNLFLTYIMPLIYFIYFIIRHKIQIIHLNNTVFAGLIWAIAAKITRTKIIAHERTRLAQIHFINKFHHRLFDYILGMSKSSEFYLKSYNINLNKYSTFYDRVDVDKFRLNATKSRKEVRKEFNLNTEQPCIGIVGNLQRWKGQLTIIDAVCRLINKYPELTCLLIGDSSKKTLDDIAFYQEINSKIHTNNLQKNIILTGHRTDIPDLLNALDIFIHASISPEPYGLVVLEAMAMGKAIIASNEGGPVEMIVNNKSGLLIQPNNSEILAESIDLLLSDKQKRQEMGIAAYNRVVNNFSKLDISFIENLYLNLLKVN